MKNILHLSWYCCLWAVLPNWGFAQPYMEGNTIVWDGYGNFDMEISGLPLPGCGNQTGAYATVDDAFREPQRIAEIQNTANSPAGQHHIASLNRKYNITVKITWRSSDRTTFGLDWAGITNASQINDIPGSGFFAGANGDNQYPRENDTETFTFVYEPQNLSGLNSDVLTMNFSIHNNGGYFDYLYDVWFYIPIYVVGAAPGQDEVPVLGQIQSPFTPYMILHDPPGDFSSATLTQGQKYCTNVEIRAGDGSGESGTDAWKVGVKGSVNIFFVSVDFEAYYKEVDGFAQSVTETSFASQEVCIEYATAISTADGIEDDTPVPPGDDLFIGSSIDMVYGVFDGWYFEDCQLKFGKRLTMAPVGDPYEKRVFESQIEQEILLLQATINSPTTTDYEKRFAQNQIEIWEQMIAINEESKATVTEVIDAKKTIAGTSSHTRTKTTQVTNSYTLNVDYTFENTTGIEWLAEAGGIGGSGGTEYRTTQTFGSSKTDASTSEQTISYTIRDGNGEDRHTFEAYNDPYFGTPLFKLFEAESETSAPYEGGYQIDQPNLKSNIANCTQANINITNAPLGQPLQVPLKFCNDSKYQRTYFLDLVDQTNINPGAKLTLGNKPLGGNDDGEEIVIPAGPNACIDAILIVEQNPGAPQVVDFKNIKLRLYPKLDPDLASIINLSVNFGNGTIDRCVVDDACDGDVITVPSIEYFGDETTTTVRASQSITTNGSVVIPQGTTVTYTAEQTITLKPGFTANGTFTAQIAPCTAPSVAAVESREEEVSITVPQDLTLKVFPNPTNGLTTIQYDLPETGAVQLTIYDIQGRIVRTLSQNTELPAGQHQVEWNASDVPSGLYLVRIQTADDFKMQKLMVAKSW